MSQTSYINMSDPFNLILNLKNHGFILGKGVEIGEKGKIILSHQTNQKVLEKIVERQQRLFSKNKNENAPISMKAMLEEIARNACGDHEFFENFSWTAADRVQYLVDKDPYFVLAYFETFAEGTENKFPDLTKIPFRIYMLNEILDETDSIKLLINLDKYSIPPENQRNEVIESVLMDIVLSFRSVLDDSLAEKILDSMGESLMPISAFRLIDKVWTSEKVPIKKIIEMMEKNSIQ